MSDRKLRKPNISAPLARRFRRRRRPANPSSPRTRRDLYDWITLTLSLAGAVLVAGTVAAAAYQASLTRDQLRASVAQQRAWLRVDSVSLNPEISDLADLKIVSFWVKLTNVGNLPAQGVDVGVKLTDELDPSALASRVRRQCDRYADAETGNTVFPGESVTVGIGTMVKGDVPKESDLSLVDTCLSYWSGTPDRRHQTRTFYMVSLLRVHTKKPTAEIELPRYMLASHAD